MKSENQGDKQSLNELDELGPYESKHNDHPQAAVPTDLPKVQSPVLSLNNTGGDEPSFVDYSPNINNPLAAQ